MSLATTSCGISAVIAGQMERSSWIRRMFETGIQLRQERGAENVFDFSLGNPEVEPPAEVLDALRAVASESRARSHGYMPNAGFSKDVVRPAAAATAAGIVAHYRTARRKATSMVSTLPASWTPRPAGPRRRPPAPAGRPGRTPRPRPRPR